MHEPGTAKQTLLKGALSGLLITSILPFLTLTVFCNPAYDDYCYAAAALKNDFFKAQSYQFNYWSGRYFSTAILSLSPITFGNFGGYKLAALIIITLTFASVFSFLAALLNSSASPAEKLIAAGFITAMFSNSVPDVTEAYYWMPGTVSYQLPNIFTLFMFAAVIKALKSSGAMRAGLLALSSILIVAVVGSSETSMLFLLLSVCAVTAKAFLMKSNNRRLWLTLLAIIVLCSCVVIFSPGNAVRAGNFPGKHRLFFSIGMSLAQEIRFIAKWVSNPALALSTILFVPITSRLTAGNVLLKDHFYIHPYSSSALLLAFVFVGLFPPYWATGLLGQYRSVNTAYLLFLLGWFINVTIWVSYFKEKRKGVRLDLPDYVYLFCLPLIAISLLLTNNTKSAFSDLISGRAYRYNQEMEGRRSQFERCAGDGVVDCQVQKISDTPDTVSNPYFVTELSCDEEYWELRTASDRNQH